MNYLQRRKVLKTINALDLIPVYYRGYEIEKGRVVVLVPKFKSSVYHRFFPRTQKLFYRIKLDELGSASWEAIDGSRNVKEIAQVINESGKFEKEKITDMEDRLNKFMTMLYERRFVSFRQILEG
jgi:hypothetical protein